jgi:hypothetical protein
MFNFYAKIMYIFDELILGGKMKFGVNLIQKKKKGHSLVATLKTVKNSL